MSEAASAKAVAVASAEAPPLSLADRVSDRINPIALKELRQAMNSRFLAGLLLALLVAMLGLLIAEGHAVDLSAPVTRGTGHRLFVRLHVSLLFAIGVGLPLFTGLRLVAEKATAAGDLLHMSPLMPWTLIRGKLYAGLTLALVIGSACAPFVVVARSFRGMSLDVVLWAFVADALFVFTSLSLSLMAGAVLMPAGCKIAFALVVLAGVVLALLLLTASLEAGLLPTPTVLTVGAIALPCVNWIALGIACDGVAPRGANVARQAAEPVRPTARDVGHRALNAGPGGSPS